MKSLPTRSGRDRPCENRIEAFALAEERGSPTGGQFVRLEMVLPGKALESEEGGDGDPAVSAEDPQDLGAGSESLSRIRRGQEIRDKERRRVGRTGDQHKDEGKGAHGWAAPQKKRHRHAVGRRREPVGFNRQREFGAESSKETLSFVRPFRQRSAGGPLYFWTLTL